MNGATSGHRPTGLADRPLQGCPVQCLGALAVRRLREDLRCLEQRAQPGLEAGAWSPGSSPSSGSCSSLHLAKPQCPHLERGGKRPLCKLVGRGQFHHTCSGFKDPLPPTPPNTHSHTLLPLTFKHRGPPFTPRCLSLPMLHAPPGMLLPSLLCLTNSSSSCNTQMK